MKNFILMIFDNHCVLRKYDYGATNNMQEYNLRYKNSSIQYRIYNEDKYEAYCYMIDMIKSSVGCEVISIY